MSARAVSSATIAFGLVSIPIKLYAATRSKTVRFHLLHAADRCRLQQHYRCRGCGERVERDQTVKGYEVGRDRHVVLTEEELEALQRRREPTIEIEEFVPLDQVDPVSLDQASLLGPDRGGARAYPPQCVLVCLRVSVSTRVEPVAGGQAKALRRSSPRRGRLRWCAPARPAPSASATGMATTCTSRGRPRTGGPAA